MSVPSTNLRLWLKADGHINLVNGQAVDSWRDRSGNELHGVGQTAGGDRRPLFTADGIGGRAAIIGDGDDRFVLPDSTIPTGSGQYSIYIAATVDTTSQAVVLYGGTASTNQAFIFGANTSGRLQTGWFGNNLFSSNDVVPQGTPFVASTHFNGSGRTQFFNGSAAGSDSQTAKNTGTGNNFIMGQSATGTTGSFVGNVHEILIYSAVHDGTTRAAIEAYLAAKWTNARAVDAPAVLAPVDDATVRALPTPVLWAPPAEGDNAPLVSFGVITDTHYGDIDTASNRFYRDGVDKLTEAANAFRAAGVEFVLQGGDLSDGSGTSNGAQLTAVADAVAALDVGEIPVYHALGNHDLDQISKAEWRTATGTSANYYSFDAGGIHFVILDPCHKSDDDDDHFDAGNFDPGTAFVGPTQRSWLTSDLAGTALPTVVFCHYPLHEGTTAGYRLTNAVAVASIIDAATNVVAVFAGHRHANHFGYRFGRPYFTLQAAAENAHPDNAYAIVRVLADRTLEVYGFRNQTAYLQTLILPSYTHGRYRAQGDTEWSAISGFADVNESASFLWDLTSLDPGTYEVQVGRTTDDEPTVQWGSTRIFSLPSSEVHTDTALAWHVREAVQQDAALAWHVREPVTADRTLLWHVAPVITVDADFGLLWSVRAPVDAERSIAWHVRQGVGASNALAWHVRAAVEAERSLLWQIRAAVNTDAVLLWNVGDAQTVELDVGLLWHVHAPVTIDRDLLWLIRERVELDRILRWHVGAAVATGTPLDVIRLRAVIERGINVRSRIERVIRISATI